MSKITKQPGSDDLKPTDTELRFGPTSLAFQQKSKDKIIKDLQTELDKLQIKLVRTKTAMQYEIDDATDDRQQEQIKQLNVERLVLAMLASDEPDFFNPLRAIQAKNLRDKTLSEAKQKGCK